MQGLIVVAGQAGSAQYVDDLPEPDLAEGEVLVEALAVGIRGTDREIAAGEYGEAPGPDGRLVLGHESLGRVISDESGRWQPGQLVAGIVRRPDPVPCRHCAVGEWDMCINGLYTECGIKKRHGFARERWRIEPSFAIGLDRALEPVGVLMEPTSVVAKAWDHIDRIGTRAYWAPQTALITGAGPIGLLAAMLGVQRGLEVHVLDRATEGPKPDLVRRLGAIYHTGGVRELPLEPDVVVECTGAAQVIADVLIQVGPGGIVCLAGVSSYGVKLPVDIGATNREIVLENNVVFGSVNANLRHWEHAARALGQADQDWLSSLITRRLPPASYAEALVGGRQDIKIMLQFAT